MENNETLEIETTTEAICLSDIQTLNDNLVMGHLGIIIGLGLVFGAILGCVYNDIFR